MIYDDTRSFLDSVRRAKERLAAAQARCETLWDATTKTTTAWTLTPGGGGDVHKDAALSALSDAAAEMHSAEEDLYQSVRGVSDFIHRIDGAIFQTILHLRYVGLMPWEEVADHLQKQNIYYSQRHITRLHGQALNAARRQWVEEHNKEDTP